MSLSRFAAASLLAALALSQPARAQEPTLRGPWLGAGIGTASAAVNCDICTDDRNGGLSGYLAGGFSFGPSLRAGAELIGWQDNTDNIRQRLLLYGASLWWTSAARRLVVPQGRHRHDDTTTPRTSRTRRTIPSAPAPVPSSSAPATTSARGPSSTSRPSRT